MNKDTVRCAANKFIKKAKGKLDFSDIREYLRLIGYSIVFYNTPEGDIELSRYNLTEKAKNTNSFVYVGVAKILFINDNISKENKKYLLYHELGHIFLKHLTNDKISTHSEILLDIEADAFAYRLIRFKKSVPVFPLLLCCITVILILSNICVKYNNDYVPISYERIISAPADNDIVCVTPSGKKYHNPNCIYVQNKDCTKLTKAEAKKFLTPCLVCNP